MKKTTTKSVAMIVFSIAVSQGAFADWTAYNDFGATHGPANPANVTEFDSGASGVLLDFATGLGTGVTLGIVGVGDVRNNQGVTDTGYPDVGTDAYAEFGANTAVLDGYIYGNSGSVTLTLSGLDAAASYTAVIFGNRGGNYTDRYTYVTIGGADSFVNDSSGGAVLSTVVDANDTTLIMTGNQTTTGQIFKYSGINAGSDGIVTLTIPAGERNYINAMKLTETIPEPGTLGLVALFGGSLLFIRRRLKR